MPLGSSVLKKWRDDIPSGLVWVDGISQGIDGWGFDGITVGHQGHRRQRLALAAGLEVPLADTQGPWFQRAATAMRYVQVPDLARSETLFDPRDVLQQLVGGIQPSRRHAVIQLSDSPRVFVPALLLIRALYGGSRSLHRHLLMPNGADLLGTAYSTPNGIEISPMPGVRYPSNSGRLARLLAWLHTRPDAKKSHASVLHHARQGEVGLSLPHVSLSFWAYGFQLDSGLLAFELSAVDVRPPINAPAIVLHARGESRSFPAYVPVSKSRWSSSYCPRAGSG